MDLRTRYFSRGANWSSAMGTPGTPALFTPLLNCRNDCTHLPAAPSRGQAVRRPRHPRAGVRGTTPRTSSTLAAHNVRWSTSTACTTARSASSWARGSSGSLSARDGRAERQVPLAERGDGQSCAIRESGEVACWGRTTGARRMHRQQCSAPCELEANTYAGYGNRRRSNAGEGAASLVHGGGITSPARRSPSAGGLARTGPLRASAL